MFFKFTLDIIFRSAKKSEHRRWLAKDCKIELVSDLQLKPYRTDEFVHKLFYETSRFSAFNNQWVVKARINNSQRDPTQSSERDMTYQVSIFIQRFCKVFNFNLNKNTLSIDFLQNLCIKNNGFYFVFYS